MGGWGQFGYREGGHSWSDFSTGRVDGVMVGQNSCLTCSIVKSLEQVTTHWLLTQALSEVVFQVFGKNCGAPMWEALSWVPFWKIWEVTWSGAFQSLGQVPARHLHKWLDRHLIKYYPWLIITCHHDQGLMKESLRVWGRHEIRYTYCKANSVTGHLPLMEWKNNVPNTRHINTKFSYRFIFYSIRKNMLKSTIHVTFSLT